MMSLQHCPSLDQTALILAPGLAQCHKEVFPASLLLVGRTLSLLLLAFLALGFAALVLVSIWFAT